MLERREVIEAPPKDVREYTRLVREDLPPAEPKPYRSETNSEGLFKLMSIYPLYTYLGDLVDLYQIGGKMENLRDIELFVLYGLSNVNLWDIDEGLGAVYSN